MTPTSTYERIRTRAAEVCEERHIHPAEDPGATRRLIADLVKQHQTEAQAGRADSLKQPDQMVDRVWRALTDTGRSPCCSPVMTWRRSSSRGTVSPI